MKNMVGKKIKKMKSRVKRWANTIYPMPYHFGDKKLKQRKKYEPDYKVLARSLLTHISFESVMDVGCAQGFLLEPLYDMGVDISGVEKSEDVLKFTPEILIPHIHIGDFSEATGSYDLVCCVEVAEHIEPTRSEELVDKLCSLSERYIYFTAAPPGQAGHGHINCRPHEQWIQWFNQSNYFVKQSVTNKIKTDLGDLKYAEWLQGNSLLFGTVDG